MIEVDLKQKKFKEFLARVKEIKNLNYELIEQALYFADNKHKGQKRLSGEDYVLHPLAVAEILLDLQLDTESIIAGLLHDVIEDTGTKKEEIKSLFGERILKLICGVTKISAIKNNYYFIQEYENLRKFIFSMIDDVRVLLIKLADRLHNMRTLYAQPRRKQIHIAKNTLDIYAPLAARLGIEWLKNEMEDLCLYYLDRKAYDYIKSQIQMKKAERKKIIEDIIEEIDLILKEEGFKNYKIKGRAKHFYSIYKKMTESNKSFEEINDLFGIRVLTDTVKNCYSILGIIHKYYKPIPGRFKDYIAIPKNNMYQSLHTTCIDDKKRKLEIQIRTYEMDHIAEFGIAAHWMYKEKISDIEKIQHELKIFAKLRKWKKEDFNITKILENLKSDILKDDIYVFTPKGDIVELPRGATVLDFAFAIHTEIGLKATGARVNGKFVPLRRELKNGELVEIITSSNKAPSYDWINIVKTRRARTKLRSYFKKLYSLEKSEEIKINQYNRKRTSVEDKKKIEKANELKPNENLDEVVEKSKSEISQKSKFDDKLYILGSNDIKFEFASCCNPEPGDKIIGFVSSKRKSVIIHKVSCPEFRRLRRRFKNKIVSVSWIDPLKKYLRKYKVTSSESTTIVISEIINSIDTANLKLIDLKLIVRNNRRMLCFFSVEAGNRENFNLFEELINTTKVKLKLVRIN